MPQITTRNVVPGGQVVQPRQTIQATTGSNRPRKVETPSPADTNRAADTKAPEAVTLSPQLTALARREQKLQAQLLDFQTKQSEFEAKQADFIPKSELQTKVRQKTSETLKEVLGVTYDELTQLILAEQNGVDTKDAAIQELSAKIDKMESSQTEAQKKQTEAVINNYRTEIGRLVDSNDEYETIKARGAQDFVLQHILDTFNDPEDGAILTIEEAAKDIEEALFNEALELTKLKKVQAKLPAPAAAPARREALPPPRSEEVRSISNTIPAPVQRFEKQSQHLSPQERIEAAVAKARAKGQQR